MTENKAEVLSKLRNEEGHKLCYSLHTVVGIESVQKVIGRVARMGEMRNSCRILIKEIRKLISLE